MRHSLLVTLTSSLLSLAVAQGCGGKVSDPNGNGGDPEAPRADGAVVDTGISGAVADTSPLPPGSTDPGTDAGPPTFADASPPVDEDAAPPPARKHVAEACALGPDALTHADQFVAFEWSREHPTCGGSSSCAVSFQLAADCAGVGYYNGVPYSLHVGAADCLTAKRWFASEALLGALRDETICPGGAAKGNPEEMGTTLTGGTTNRKVDPACVTAPFLQNRECIDALLADYVPGPTVWP